MIELINQLTEQLNINNKQAEGGVGAILKIAQEKLADGDFSSIAQVFGGQGQVNSMIAKAPSEGASGLLGTLGGITSALGVNTGSMGSLMSLAGSFQKLDMSSETLSKFAPIVVNWATENGGENVKNIINKILK